MLLAHHVGGEDPRGRAQRIHSGVDALAGNGTVQNRGGIQVGKGSGGGRISQVVGRDVDCLDRGNRPLLGGGDPLLERAHLGGQSGLIAHGRGHAAQQGRNLRARLGETEDVVNEKEHILVFPVPEILRHGKTGKAHPHTGSRGLVHLAVDQGGLGQNPRLFHLVVEVVALTGTLTHAGKHRQAAMLFGNVVDEFHDKHSLAHAGAAEETDLAALGVGADEVHHLDACLQDLGGALLLIVGGGLAVDGPTLLSLRGRPVVHRLSQKVEDPPQGTLSHGDGDGSAGIHGRHTTGQAVGACHSDAASHIVADVLGHLQSDGLLPPPHRDGVEQLRQRSVGKFDVQHRSDDLDHRADILLLHNITPFPIGGAAERGLRGVV